MASAGGGASQSSSTVDYEMFKSAKHYTSPEEYLKLFEQFLPAMMQIGEPSRVQATDMANVQGGNLLSAHRADAGRRGLSGSGFDLSGQGAIRGGTAANVGNILQNYYQQALLMASNQAKDTQGMRLAAHTNAPFQTHSSSWDASVAVAA